MLQSLGRYTCDGLADVFTQNELGVIAQLIDAVPEFQFFLGIGIERPVFSEQADKLPEEIAVVEFGSGKLTQLGNALRSKNAQLLEFIAGQCSGTVLRQHGDGDVITFESLYQAMRHDLEFLGFHAAAFGARQ